MFRNRINELKLLEDAYNSKKPELIIVYGRRRVGKTALLVEFSRRHGGLYLLSRQESEKDQLDKMSSDIAKFFKDETLEKNPFRSYDAMFTYLSERAGRTPIVFDEFPYMVESNKSLPSILQDHWENRLSKKNAFIVLCGSSMGMMESLLGAESPLYGRRTGQILLEPMKFRDACLFFGALSKEEKVRRYSILGGTPAYLLEFDNAKEIGTNVREKILQKNTFLSQDVLFVLKTELEEPRNYFSILKSIAKGNTKIGQIMNDTGLDKSIAAKYLSVLSDLHLVKRLVPITEDRPSKSRRGVYALNDNYFRFWFRFVFENGEYIEQDEQDTLLKNKITPELDQYVGRIYEDIARDWLKSSKIFPGHLFGSWWDKDEEIDVVGINEASDSIVFCEIKWSDLGKKDLEGILGRLREKAKKVNWGGERKETYVIIGRRVESRQIEGCQVFDLSDITGA